jgi:hypothetical protein
MYCYLYVLRLSSIRENVLLFIHIASFLYKGDCIVIYTLYILLFSSISDVCLTAACARAGMYLYGKSAQCPSFECYYCIYMIVGNIHMLWSKDISTLVAEF